MADFEINTSLSALSLAQCVDTLFGLKLSRYPKLKDGLHSMLRNKLIKHHKTAPEGGEGSRAKILICRDQLDTIFNATLIHGIFSEPKQVLEIFNSHEKRMEMTCWLSRLLLDRNSVAGIGLLSQEVTCFLEILASDADLRSIRLPNPFVELPQLSLGGVTGVMQGALVQTATMSAGDSMMTLYLNGQLKQAWEQAEKLQTENILLNKYKALIIREYSVAIEFDEVLDFFR